MHTWPEATDGQPHPARAQWKGALYAPSYGGYEFQLVTNGTASMHIDGSPVVSSTVTAATVTLAQGLHSVAAEADLPERPQFEVRWKPPGQAMALIPTTVFFRNPSVHGLLARYEGKGGSLERIEPFPYYRFFPATFPGLFSVRWRGVLRVPHPGGYELDVVTGSSTQVLIDGRPWPSSTRLGAGPHDIEMSIRDISGAAQLELNWSAHNVTRVLVPPSAFSPPGGGIDGQTSPGDTSTE
jgi:hypothetical protein